jgi:outer membrane protein assembly factor BamD
MILQLALYNLLFAIMVFLFTGCTSVALPSISLPSISLPWSGPKTEPNADATALFREGEEYLNKERYALAIDRFQRVKTEFPFAPEVTAAELKLAETYYRNKQYAEAISGFKEFQSLHPNNENMPFVVYHLGLANLDQFTAVDRDLKTTELAKGYFETVIKDYPKSEFASLAQAKLEKCNGYLAEHEFIIASFYLRQEKYAAARDRLDTIVRRYRGTPTAIKALYYLGEAYRLEKNTVKAALAYSALVQHYPEAEFAKKAQVQLAEVMQEKQDPLALLLMRDGRGSVSVTPAEESTSTASNAVLPPNLVAKKDVVYEEPGSDKNIFQRVVAKINPFSSSDDDKDGAQAKLATGQKDAAQASKPGAVSSVWKSLNPFAKAAKPSVPATPDPQLSTSVDTALKERGIQPAQTLTPPAADLPQVSTGPVADPARVKDVLQDVDIKLDKNGQSVATMPAPPEAHPVFGDPAAIAKIQAAAKSGPAPSSDTASVLNSVDEKLKSQGIDPTKVEMPVPVSAAAANPDSTPPPARVKKVELDSRLPDNKGPLFKEADISKPPAKVQPEESTEEKKDAQNQPAAEPSPQLPSAIVKGAPPRVKETTLDPKSAQPEESPVLPDALDQIRKDAESIKKALNPLSW